MDLNENIRYIQKVIYGQKDSKNHYDVIKKIYFFRWEKNKNKFSNFYCDRELFANGLLNNQFKAVFVCNYIENPVAVIAYKQDDGEIWLKTMSDDSMANNLELLEYAKAYNLAEKE